MPHRRLPTRRVAFGRWAAVVRRPKLRSMDTMTLHPAFPDAASVPAVAGWELRFESLFDPGRALSFPCDAAGLIILFFVQK